MIWLFPGISLEQHWDAVGTDVHDLLQFKLFDDENGLGVVYVVRDMDDDLLRTVRADRGVQLVECNQRVYLV